MNLQDLNRQEWSEVPFTIRLVDGPGDGTVIEWPGLPGIWRFPVPTPLADLLRPPLDDLRPTFADRAIDYEQTNQVADDGAHLYRMR